jgi:hypothetical protein
MQQINTGGTKTLLKQPIKSSHQTSVILKNRKPGKKFDGKPIGVSGFQITGGSEAGGMGRNPHISAGSALKKGHGYLGYLFVKIKKCRFYVRYCQMIWIFVNKFIVM